MTNSIFSGSSKFHMFRVKQDTLHINIYNWLQSHKVPGNHMDFSGFTMMWQKPYFFPLLTSVPSSALTSMY